jgi:hypothetical protein
MDPVLGVFLGNNPEVGYCSLLVKPCHTETGREGEPDQEGKGGEIEIEDRLIDR